MKKKEIVLVLLKRKNSYHKQTSLKFPSKLNHSRTLSVEI